MKRSLPSASVIPVVLVVLLGFYATPARAQRGARSDNVSTAPAARPAYSQANATHGANIAATVSRQSSRLSASHSSLCLLYTSQLELHDEFGVTHRLWPVVDAAFIRRIQSLSLIHI